MVRRVPPLNLSSSQLFTTGTRELYSNCSTGQPNTNHVPSGTVCLECIVGGALATEASFQIENNQVAPSEGTVVNGTLVVFDSETTFSEENTIVRCMSGSASHGSKSNSTHFFFSGRRGDIDRCVCQETKWSHNWSDTSEGVY